MRLTLKRHPVIPSPCLLFTNMVWLGFEHGWLITVMLSWWRHQMEIFSALLALCAGNSPVTGEFPAQRPVTRSFDIFFDLRLNKRLSKQSWGWWFETLSRPLWRHCNELNLRRILLLWYGWMITSHSFVGDVINYPWPNFITESANLRC